MTIETPSWAPPFPPGPLLTEAPLFNPVLRLIDQVHRLPSARVVLANYPLLQHDFPHLSAERMVAAMPHLSALPEPARTTAIHQLIDRWLLCMTGFVSTYQKDQQLLNSPIAVGVESAQAMRPHTYGRALVLCLKTLRRLPSVEALGFVPQDLTGLLDVKGIGLAPGRALARSAHQNGLLMLGEGLRECLFGALLDAVLRHGGHPARALPNYALLDAGFDVIRENGDPVPAGLLVRRAHLRPHYPMGLKDPGSTAERMEMALEALIRRYGLTSTGSDTNLELFADAQGAVHFKYGQGELTYSREIQEWIVELTGFKGQPLQFEGVNLQFTDGILADPPHPQIVDFGAFWVKQRFAHPLVCLVASRPMRIGTQVWPDSPTFAQPDPALCLPQAYWGDTGGIWGFGQKDTGISYPLDTPSILCHSLALGFRRQKLSAQQVGAHLAEMIRVSTAHWPDRPTQSPN